jgi:putative transcriptional regulator
MKCHLSRILGEKRLKISTVVDDTGINRGTITRMFHEKAQRVELEVLDKLCCYLDCTISDLLEPVYNREEDEKVIKCQTFKKNGEVLWEKVFIKPEEENE